TFVSKLQPSVLLAIALLAAPRSMFSVSKLQPSVLLAIALLAASRPMFSVSKLQPFASPATTSILSATASTSPVPTSQTLASFAQAQPPSTRPFDGVLAHDMQSMKPPHSAPGSAIRLQAAD